MATLRTTILVAILCLLSALAAEPPFGPGSRALSRQAAGGEGAGGLQQIQPGHYVYLHTDDTPGCPRRSTAESSSRTTGSW